MIVKRGFCYDKPLINKGIFDFKKAGQLGN